MSTDLCHCGNPAVVHGLCAACAKLLRADLIHSLDEATRIRLERMENPSPFRGSREVVAQVQVDGSPRVLYLAEQCPLCGQPWAYPKVLYSRLGTPIRHTDLYTEYPVLDANRYEFSVCTQCGYAAPDNSPPLRADEIEAFRALTAVWEPAAATYLGERSEVAAILGYRVALFFASRRRRQPHLQQGRIHLRLAWLHRRAGRKAEEQAELAKAVAALERTYTGEDTGDVTAQLPYLIGELHFRLGHLEEAAQWFYRAANTVDTRERRFQKLARARLDEVARCKKAGFDPAQVRWTF